jgi:T5SS/PEP-CTERM-associated repeat protein
MKWIPPSPVWRFLFRAGVLAFISVTSTLHANTVEFDWVGGGSGSFSDAGNWNNANTNMPGVPGAGDAAVISDEATISGNGSPEYLVVQDNVTFTGNLSPTGSPDSAGFFVGAYGGIASATFNAGSSLTCTTPWDIGDDYGLGQVNVFQGAMASATGDFALGDAAINLGFSGGASGGLDISGTNSTVTSGGEINVGLGGLGTLMIMSGGTLTSSGDAGAAGAQIATEAGTGGSSALVSGSGSTWTNTGELDVGVDAYGTLKVEDGAQLTTGDSMGINPGLNIGYFSSGNGFVTVDGSGSSLTCNDQTVVGNSFQGTLTISGGGTMSTTSGGVILASGSDGNGTATIMDPGSTWTIAGGLIIGDGGTAEFSLSGGGLVQLQGSDTSVDIGSQAGSIGEIDFDGANSGFTGVSTMTIGDAGMGTVNLTDGAQISTTGDVVIANQDGSGTLSNPSVLFLDGSGTSFTVGGNLTVGMDGDGQLQMGDSAVAFVTGDMVLAAGFFGDGVASISGTGSMLTVQGSLTVGGSSEAAFSDLSGATVTSQTAVIGADEFSVDDTVDILSTDTLWHTYGDMTIGLSGSGSVNVATGATLQVDGNLVIGQNADSNGMLTINGDGTTFTYGGTGLTIGSSGTGTMVVQNGASVDLSDEAITIGENDGSSGDLTVDGSGSQLNADSVSVGESAGVDGGVASFTMSNGGSAFVATLVTVGSKGTIDVSGGGLAIGPDSTQVATGDVQVDPGGTLGGNGQIFGNVINGGIVAPGGAATLSLSGSYAQVSGGLLELTISGTDPEENDHLDIGGELSLQSGSILRVDFIDGFEPVAGDSFPLIAFGSLDPANDDFSSLEIEGASPGLEFMVTSNDDFLDLDVSGVAVPEPSTWAMLLGGLGLLIVCQVRKRGKIC